MGTKQNTTNTYYFHLFSNVLTYSSKRLGTTKQFTLKRHIYLYNMHVIDQSNVSTDSASKNSKKKKKKNRKTLTIKYWEEFNLERMQQCENMDAIEDDDDIKTFSLIFDTIKTKETWYLLLNNLINAERAKCINVNGNDANKALFCGICHCAFNRFFNIEHQCIKCCLSICSACSTENFYLTKTVMVPSHLKLCTRCNFHNDNERSCNVTVV